MSKSLRRTCPHCQTERDFYLAASTSLHLGKKTKWHCPECDYGFVRIDDVVDTRADAGA
jgi:rubredoxin